MTEKQTAVEWLYNLSKQRELDKFDLEQAKEMEKQQMQDFGARCCLMTKQKHEWTLEQLYNETYGSKGSDALKNGGGVLISEGGVLKSSQTEISDEEIEEYAKRNAFQYYEFITGAKWYREQLKQRQ